ncbi:MAG: autotransporter-associated beta strand repeat-containing protein, partial [Moraxellaceae bacterium]|nr:autotransporter-associated beta strand repeat-containing protein [Moraxellaceae bacterium]
MTGVISEDAAKVTLVKQGAGTLSLTNNNTYTGGTDVQAGTLSIKRASGLGDGDVELAAGTTLETQSSTTLTQHVNLSGDAIIKTGGTKAVENITQVTSSIDGVGGLTKVGAGTLSLTADNGYMGNTIIKDGTLAISRAGSLGAAGTQLDIENATLKTNQDVVLDKDKKINIVNSGKGTINTGGANSTVEGQITGVGGILEKTGDGALTLINDNTYTGGTVINGGILIISDEKNLGTGDVTIKQGTLQTAEDMLAEKGNALTRNIITSSSSGGSINTAGHDVDLQGKVTLKQIGTDASGKPVFEAGRLVKTGGGTLKLTSSDNDYDIGRTLSADGKTVAVVGNTVINGGVLSISKNEQLGKDMSFTDFPKNPDGTDSRVAAWETGNLLMDGGTLETTQSLTTQRAVNIGAAGATVSVEGAANVTTLEGKLRSTGGGLTKEGDGTLNISLASGKYTEDDGSINADYKENSQTLGQTTIKGGVLAVDNIAKDLGGAALGIELAGGDLRIGQASNLTKLILSGEGGSLDTTGATITAAFITGDGDLQKKGSGTLVLTGVNTYTGDTTVSEGKVQISSEAGLGDANSGKLVLNGGSLQVVGGGTVNLGKDAVITSSNGTIDTTGQNVTLSGTVSGAGQLVKAGSGKFTLTGDNTFEGGVRIKAGVLEVNKDNALGKETGDVFIDGATLAVTQDAELKRNLILTEKGGTVSVVAGTATLEGNLSLDAGVLSADFTKAEAGNLNLATDNTSSGFKGNTIIKAGTLGITSQNNLAQGKLFLDGGNLRTNASLTFNKEIIINTTGGIDTALDALGSKTEVTVSSKVQGNGAFVKSGEGTLTLSGDNAYAGGTQVNGGVLVVNDDKNLGLQSTAITLNGGTLKLNTNNSVDLKHQMIPMPVYL